MDRRRRHSLVGELLDYAKQGIAGKWISQFLVDIPPFPWTHPSVLPIWDERIGYPLPIAIVGLMGLSSAGKSTLIQSLTSVPPDDMTVICRPEFSTSDREQLDISWAFRNHGSAISLYMETIKITDSLIFQRDEVIKAVNRRSSKSLPIQRIVIVNERDCNDALAYLFWHLLVAQREKRLSESYLHKWSELFMYALSDSMWTDAVAFFHIPQSTTEQRRIANGLPAEGKVVNRENRPYFEAAYGTYLNLHRLLHARQGMGLLNIDGEQTKEDVRNSFLNYCRQLVGLA